MLNTPEHHVFVQKELSFCRQSRSTLNLRRQRSDVMRRIFVLKLSKLIHSQLTFILVWRGWMAKRNFQRRLKAAQVIQHYIRRYLALKRSRERCVAKLVGGISENQVNAGKLSPAFTKNNCTDLKSVERLQFLSADGGKGCQTPSWFDQLDDTKNGKFTPTCSVFLGSKRFTLSSVRGHQRINPLAALMSNCNAAKINSQGSSANKQNLGIQTVNRSSAILSRRDIAKVFFFFFFLICFFFLIFIFNYKSIVTIICIIEKGFHKMQQI